MRPAAAGQPGLFRVHRFGSLRLFVAVMLWLGTGDGLNRYEHGKLTVYRSSSGLAQDIVGRLECVGE